ncbi:MAG: hypothetical protein GY820_39840 [Gammaproteobacteria bacterium]|nr:hypothetical protein [Gammaproteobacteria bacterium]
MQAKIYLNDGGFGTTYTTGVLHKFCEMNGVAVTTDKSKADILLVSMCDPSDLALLKQARKDSSGQPVVMGGFEGYFATPYLAWADGANVGEGLEFFKALGSGADWRMLPCVLTRNDSEAHASYEIDWTQFPLVKTGKRKAYMLAARGCHNKCKFCATSWVQPHQMQPQERLVAIMQRAKGLGVTMICNDARGLPKMKRLNGTSLTVKDYLASGSSVRAMIYRFGIEGWTEDQRREFGKPVTDEQIVQLIELTKQRKQRCELFFLVGQRANPLSDVRALAELIPQDTKHLPSIHVKMTYFDPCPHTPFHQSMPALHYIDTKKAFRILNARNKRFRVFPTRSVARSNWRTVLHRCTPEQAVRLGPEPRDTNTEDSREAWLKTLDCDLRELAGEISHTPCSEIKTRVRRA